MKHKTQPTSSPSVRIPKKEAIHTASSPDPKVARCAACDSVWPEGSLSCLACGVYLPVIHDFGADSEIVTLGKPIRLSWEVEHADAVWFRHAEEALPLSGQEDVYPMQSTTYVLVARSEAGEVTREVSVSLPAPDIFRFESDQREIDLNYPVIFSWEATNAEIVTIEPEVGEVSGLSFCEARLKKPGMYELRVKNASGEARAKVFLTLPRPEIGLFTALQDHVEPGEPLVLHWEAENADTLTLMPEGLDVSGQTQVEVFPDRSTTYRLLAANSAGEVDETVFVPLPQPVVTEFASPKPISTEGESIYIRWDVKYAYRVEIEPNIGEVATTGRATFRPRKAFTEFNLKATGYSGVVTASLTVSRFPLPIEDFNENDLFRDIHSSIKSHEKMLRKQTNALRSARSLPDELAGKSPEDLLKRGSVASAVKKGLKSLFTRKFSSNA